MSVDLDASLDRGDRDSRSFWTAVRDGRLVLQRCSACRRARFPAMPGCPYCGSPGGTEEVASGRGALYSWITVHRALDPDHVDEVPYTVAVVSLEEGPRAVGRFVPGRPPRFDEPVRLAVTPSRRTGLLWFEPDGRRIGDGATAGSA